RTSKPVGGRKNGTSVPLMTSIVPLAKSLVVLRYAGAFLFACSALYTRTTRYWLLRRWCPGMTCANWPGHRGNVAGPGMLILRPTWRLALSLLPTVGARSAPVLSNAG